VKNSKMLFTAIVVAAALGAAAYYLATSTPFEQRKPAVNAIAPEIALADLSGKMITLADYRNSVILINFWASWCPPCKEQLKLFQEAYNRYEKSGLTVIAVSLDEISPGLVREMGISYPVLMANDRILADYGNIKGVPRTFLIGRDGRIIKKLDRYYREKSLAEDIRSALEQD